MNKKYLILILIPLIFWYSCKNKKTHLNKRDTTVNEITSFNNLFLDSVQLESFLKTHTEFKTFENQYLDFYKQRNYEYAWFDSTGIAEQSHNFINLLSTTMDELQDSSLYNKKLMYLYDTFESDTTHVARKKDVLLTELLLTGQFFAYAAKVYKGSDINAAELGWFIPRKKVNLSALLDSTLKSKVKATDQYISINSQYKKLQEYLDKYFVLEKKNSNEWDDTIAVPAKLLKKKASSPIIPQIKRRLWLLGDMNIEDVSVKFDSALLSATKRFQWRMGLSPDGVIGAKMIEELNIPLRQRISQLLVNMERARWMPPEKDTNYIMVNIPEYKMHVYDSGRLMFDMNVIVGKATNGTVIFKGNLKYIVFSPYWNVPTSIVKKDILPSINKDRHYLQKNNMEITGRSNGIPVVRQKPGANNSLGLVKFLFPNNYDIYFHDTPNRDLFDASSRSFSHGCIRLGEPKKFAQYLLRSDTATTWRSSVIDSCMHLPSEKWVTLKKTIPVFIVYFTAWIDDNGQLNFRKDIYGHDQKMSEKLFMNK